MPVAGGRSGAGRNPQQQLDEVTLNAEENLDLLGFMEEMERLASAHTQYVAAQRNRDRKLEELDIKGGPHQAYRLRDFRITYVPGQGETKHIEMDRAPISKVHVARIAA